MSAVRRRDRVVVAYLGAFGAMGVVQLALGPSLDTLRAHTGATTATIGVLFTASSLGYLVGVLLAGQIVAHRDVHGVLRVGLLIVAAMALCVPGPSSLAVLIAVETVLGFGMGLIEIGGNSVVLWRFRGGAAMNALHAAFAIGATIAPIIVGRSLAWTNGIGAAWVAAAVITLAPFVLLVRRAGPANPHVAVGRGIPPGAALITALGAVWFAIYVGVEIGVAGWIYDYARDRGIGGTQTVTALGAVFLGAFAVGRIAGVPIARRVSAARMLAGDHALAIVAALALTLAGDHAAAIWPATALLALGLASMFPSMLSVSDAAIPATGTVTSIYMIGSGVGSMTVPVLIGVLLDRHGAAALPLVTLVGMIVAAALAAAFVGRARSAPLPRVATAHTP
jgi:fucose permease